MQSPRPASYQQRLNEKKSDPGAKHDAVDVQQKRHGPMLGEGTAKKERRCKTDEYGDDHSRSHNDEKEPPSSRCNFNRDSTHEPTSLSTPPDPRLCYRERLLSGDDSVDRIGRFWPTCCPMSRSRPAVGASLPGSNAQWVKSTLCRRSSRAASGKPNIVVLGS